MENSSPYLSNKYSLATEDNKCFLCRGEVDYIEHFFFDCPPVSQFWSQFEVDLLHMKGIRLNVKVYDILFGIKHIIPNDNENLKHFINHLILIGKMCISIYKKTEENVPLHIICEQLMHRKLNLT
eukprot:TRINITY_DN43906_c0_g1_i1.p1 TRINITY_DN43906_c0_g1~~TRINITY_DN43906_c0_g1_i1.p1  ORF type:complete len:125 (+),score=13.01 TRINITY_DN43906_c0_g1_i1:655-1029(+)